MQKRFTPRDSEWEGLLSAGSRFTERAKHAITAANETARDHRHDYLGTEHLGIGILHMSEGFAISAVEAAGVPVEQAREALNAALGPARTEGDPGFRQPFTRYAAKAMDLTLREGLRLGPSRRTTDVRILISHS